MSLKQSKNT